MKTGRSPSRSKDGDEYDFQDVGETMDGSFGGRLAKYIDQISRKTSSLRISGSFSRPLRKGYYITEKDMKYKFWWMFMVVIATYSSFFTPLEFGFFRGLPRSLWIVDLVVQVVFMADIVLRFFIAYTDRRTLRLVTDHRSIALKYIKSHFILDLLGCLPWDTIYKGLGHKEEIRFLVWVRLWRVRKVDGFFVMLEKDIRINYFAARIVKLLAVEFYCTHTAACIYYYLATTVRAADESYTWIGSLTLGSFSYHNFRAIDIGKRYVTSLYWAILTMATVGYGDIHAVNIREMIFVMAFVSFDMILGAYLLGNMTALIVKGSHTEKYRDKMTSLNNFMDRNQLPRSIRKQLKSHVRMQFASGILQYDENVLSDLPASLRSKVGHEMYMKIVKEVSIFKGCTDHFLNEIVNRVTEESCLPNDVVIAQGGPSDALYIVLTGSLEEFLIGEDGKEECINLLEKENVFGDVGVICDVAQPVTVRVRELCKILRLDKQSFLDMSHDYFKDGRKVIQNLQECKDTDARLGLFAENITMLIAKQEAERALMVNNASYQGDLETLKHLMKDGAFVLRPDYDGRTPLHLAASKGYEPVVAFLIRENADVNAVDKFGVSPLLEAVRAGHDGCMSILMERGAELHLQDEGAFLCKAIKSANSDLVRRTVVAGVNVSASDYDLRTALHLAAAEGSLQMAKLLIDAGADVFAQDRWGRTPLDEGMFHKHGPLTTLLKEAAQKNQGKPATAQEKKPSPVVPRLPPPPKGSGGSLGEELDDGKSSPGSMDSYGGMVQRGRPSGVERQSSSERRSTVGLDGPYRGNSHFDEISPHQYRMFPVRRPGRPAAPLEYHHQGFSAQSTRRRATIFPYHPWTPARSRTAGKVEWVPSSLEDILNLALKHFGKLGSKVLNQDAGEISSTDLIMDAEKIYVVDDDDILTGGYSH